MVSVALDTPHWDHHVNFVIMAHNTTHYQSLKGAPTEIFHGHIPYNAFDLNFINPVQINRNKIRLRILIQEVNQKYKDTTVNSFESFHK